MIIRLVGQIVRILNATLLTRARKLLVDILLLMSVIYGKKSNASIAC